MIARSVKQDQIITILQDELRALRWRVTQLETQIDWAYNPSKRKACRHV